MTPQRLRSALFALVALASACSPRPAAPPALDRPAVEAPAAGAEAPKAAAADDLVVYGVVPPLYGRPPLQAVTRSLPDLARLGATVVWLTPIFETIPGDFGYAVTDSFRVRADYGTEDDLHALVDRAHALGLRVILDMVMNHTSDDHPYFREASRLGPRSRYFAYYARDASGAPTHYFDWVHLPNLDYDNEQVGRWMSSAAERWIRDAHVDGYRLDAAWGVRERSPRFWRAWIDGVRRIEPGAFLLAEAPARDPFYLATGFDATYDWSGKLGEAAWAGVFDDSAPGVADRLHQAVAASGESDAARNHVLRFLDNNDTGPRFVTRHGPELTRVAAAALLTLPGVPCLFTGDERGAEYEPYAQREALPQDDPAHLGEWYARLLALRHARPSLRGDGLERVLPFPAEPDVYAYLRRDDAARESTLVVLNFGSKPARVTLPVTGAPPGATWRDLLSGRTVSVSAGGAVALDLPPHAVTLLAP
jgi:glycosidase